MSSLPWSMCLKNRSSFLSQCWLGPRSGAEFRFRGWFQHLAPETSGRKSALLSHWESADKYSSLAEWSLLGWKRGEGREDRGDQLDKEIWWFQIGEYSSQTFLQLNLFSFMYFDSHSLLNFKLIEQHAWWTPHRNRLHGDTVDTNDFRRSIKSNYRKRR